MELNRNKKQKINHFLLAALITGGTALLCAPLANTQNYHVVSFILLFVVSILATFMGTGPVLLASTLSAIFWNFFFIPPHYTFHIEKTEDILIFGLFFIIALVNGVLTTRVRKQEKLVRDREKRTNALFQLTKELSKASGINEVLKVAINEIRNHFHIDSLFILQDGENTLRNSGRLQKEKQLTPEEYNAAKWAFKNARKAGALSPHPMGIDFTIYPLQGNRVSPGVVIVKLENEFTTDQQSYWDTFLVQISNALEREFLGEMAQRVRFLDESDRLYKTLFNSISHELRIPVATIMGASDSMLNSSNSSVMQSALSNEIFTASLRLNRLIENLLNISRLESGHISARLDWYDMNDLVNKVADDLKNELKSFTLKIDVPEEMPLVKIDFGLMEQVLYNLLINSTQYAPPASDILLSISYSSQTMLIEVSDNGPGFSEKEISLVFKKFFRVNENKTGGLGLGLSIAKGFVEAHSGTISIENRDEGGAKFSIRIPTEEPDIKNLQETGNE
ncbi:His Kinase A (phospho-acceptor) domain-containing protein [Tangfeifania diversioriginum]|uniref:histidine kinase n=1 Tax=Tangfeifania diversioriginum TaxID=1168035 RepID=A0A1M6A6E6_9BACT|nr:ATP-binding protein [Tangfeifania diversioriginum]SHI32005.1 His Kinase A (phospho-acceptor) domain-containing protein [Tangfeifania diversioriginum]